MIITNEKRIIDLADSIVGRTNEVYQYDINIANYQLILSSSTGEYPEHLLHLKDLPYQQAIAQCEIEHLAELAALSQHSAISHVIRTEVVERTKSNSILQVLISQLRSLVTDEEYDAAIAAAVTRRG